MLIIYIHSVFLFISENVSLYSAEYPYLGGVCTEFSQPAVWRGEPGGLWLQPLPAGGATALLWRAAHERHVAADDAQRGQRDWTPPGAREKRNHHWPDGRHSLLLLPQLTRCCKSAAFFSSKVLTLKARGDEWEKGWTPRKKYSSHIFVTKWFMKNKVQRVKRRQLWIY